MRTVRCRTVAKGAFNRIRCPQMRPMLGREIEERQQCVAVPEKAIDGLVVLGRVFLGEGRHRGVGDSAVFGEPDFAQIPMRVGLNRLRQLVENVQGLVLPASLVTVEGKASSRAFQKPSAPSPTAMSGAIDRPAPLDRQAVPSSSGRFPACPSASPEAPFCPPGSRQSVRECIRPAAPSAPADRRPSAQT